MELLKPIQVTVTDADKQPHEYIISRMPATVAREVVAKYTGGTIPKVGEYESNHAAMLKMMRYVGKQAEDGDLIMLTNASLIDNHVPDGEALIRLEIEMMRHNTSFFGSAGSQTLTDFLQSKLAAFAPKIMSMLTGLSQQLSAQDLQHSQNSKPQSTSKKRATSGK